VRTALTSVDGITEIETDPSGQKCTFSAPAGLDVKATLNKIAEDGNKHIKDWSFAENE
jgi:copper chaperone CopZ